MYAPKKMGAAQNPARVGQQRHLLTWLATFIWAALLIPHNARALLNAQSDEVRALTVDAAVERELSGGQTHYYKIALAAGEYAHAVVEQKGIDVVVKIFGSDGKLLAEVDSPNGTQGPEPIYWVAETAGDYRLEISSLEKDAQTGRYAVRLDEARPVASGDRERVALEKAFAEGTRLLAQGTKESIEAGLNKFTEAQQLSQALGDFKRAGLLLSILGNRWLTLGSPQRALESFTQALTLARSSGDGAEEANSLNNLAAANARLGENQKALDYFGQALPLARRVGNRSVEAATLTNLGYINERLSEYQQAVGYYRQALAVYETTADRKAEATVLNNLATAHFSLDERQQALDYHQRALALRVQIGDRRGVAISLRNLGPVYNAMGDQQRALDYYQQSLPLFRALSERQGEAQTLYAIGTAYAELHEPRRALDAYQQALPLLRAVSDRDGEAATLVGLGTVYRVLGDQRQALEHYEGALSLARSLGDRNVEAEALLNLGIAHETAGAPQLALEHYTAALALARAIRAPEREASALFYQARVTRALGAPVAARQLLEAALAITESLRIKVIGPELRASFLAARQNYYEEYIALLMELQQTQPGRGHDAAALQASERARARGLLELLTEAGADIRRDVAPPLLAKERALRQQLNAKAARQTALLSRKQDPAQAALAAQEIAALAAQLQDVETELRRASPRYAALTQPQPLNAAEIQQLLDDDTLLLEYALGEKNSYLWAVTPTAINSYQLPPRAEIETAARKVYDSLIARQPQPGLTATQQLERVKKAEAEYPTQAAALSRMLLAPVAGQLGNKRLVIVAAGMLEYLPFAALPDPAAENKAAAAVPLLVNHEVINLPSASALAVLRREAATKTAATKSVAVLADPVFTPDDPRVGAISKNRKTAEAPNALAVNRTAPATAQPTTDLARAVRDFNFSAARDSLARLPFSREEAETILALAPRGAGLKALSFAASRQTATSPELSQYRLVHFATHGLLNSEHPELSGLVFSLVDEMGQWQDGFLRLHEIFNLRLSADLVVLSACQTALGKQIKGEGLVGLTRGFMYAGAPRIVASLWQVNDLATAELMKHFYRGLLTDGLRPAAALRAAQLELLKGKQWTPPYYWAAFVLQGEWR